MQEKRNPEKHTGRFSLAQSSSALSASTGPVTASYDVRVPRIVCEWGLRGGSSLLSEEIRTWRRVEKPRSSLTVNRQSIPCEDKYFTKHWDTGTMAFPGCSEVIMTRRDAPSCSLQINQLNSILQTFVEC